MNFMMIVIYVNFVIRVILDNRDVSLIVIKRVSFFFIGDLYIFMYVYIRIMCLFFIKELVR